MMKLKKNVLFLFFFVSIFSNIILNALLYKTGRSHAPLAILIDQIRGGKSNESPEDKSLRSVILTFRDLIKQKACPILATQAILHNFLYRKKNWDDEKHNENKELKDLVFNSENWKIYHPDNMQFYLLIPEELNSLLKFFNKEFKDKEIETKDGNYFDLIEKLDPGKVKPSAIQASDLENFLKVKLIVSYKKKEKVGEAFKRLQEEAKYPIWDVYIKGHGLKDADICDLSPEVLQGFLIFFNNKVDTGIFIADSCYVGGTNLEFFKFKKGVKDPSTFFNQLNYLIIAMGVEESSTYYQPLDFIKIFSITKNLGKDKEHSLQVLLLQLNPKKNRGTIPQIILPGGIEIQTLYPDKQVKVIGKVVAKVAEAEGRPLILFDYEKMIFPSNILIYPAKINIPVEVKAKLKHVDLETKKTELRYLPTVNELIQEAAFWLFLIEKANKKSLSFFSKEKYLQMARDVIRGQKYKKNFLPVYPNFISMISGDATQFFKKIEIKKWFLPERKLDGVMNFLRDAFLNIKGRLTTKTFLIEELTGRNDLIFLLESCRAIKGETKKRELETVPAVKNVKDELVLQDVIVTTRGDYLYDKDGKMQYKNYVVLSFKIGNSAWEFNLDPDKVKPDDLLWNFKKIDKSKYEARFKEFFTKQEKPVKKVPQKILGEVLKEKITKLKK